MPHKHLWKIAHRDGTTSTCDLEPVARNRVLLTVTRGGETIVRESFASKADALARSVGLYKELKESSARDRR